MSVIESGGSSASFTTASTASILNMSAQQTDAALSAALVRIDRLSTMLSKSAVATSPGTA